MPKILQQESRVISLGEESNDMYISLDMVFLTSEVNLNHVLYSEEFIYGVEAEKDKYIGLPLQCDVTKLEKGEYDKLTHKYNKKKNTFGTVSIGSFVDFKTRKVGGFVELIASARIWKRNVKTCMALEELYGSDEGLKFSYEVLVGKSSKAGGIETVPKDDSNNPIGSCVVSNPAVKESVAITLCAAYEEDFIINENIKGGEIENVQRNKDFSQIDMFKDAKITLIAELDMEQIQCKLYHALQSFITEDWYDYNVKSQSMEYIIVKKYCDGDIYKIDYTVNETDVTLSNMRKVTTKYEDIPEEENKVTIAELETLVAAKEAIIKEKDKTIQEKDTEIDTNKKDAKAKEDKKVEEDKVKKAELDATNEKLTVLSASLLEKENVIKEFEPIKLAHETMIAEKAAEKLVTDKATLKEKFSKVLSAEVVIELAEAFENLDEAKINAKIVELAMATANAAPDTKTNISLASRILDTVKMSGSAEPGSLQEKYSI